MLPFLLVQKRATNLFLFFPLSWDWSLVKMWEHCQSLYKQLKWCPEVDTTTVQWYWSHLPNFPSYLYCWRHGPVLGGPKIANLWQLSVCQLFFLIKFCVGCGTFATYNRWKSSATFGCKGSEMVTIQAHTSDNYATNTQYYIRRVVGLLHLLELLPSWSLYKQK